MARREQLRLRNRMHDNRFLGAWRVIDAVHIGAAELDRHRTRRRDQEALALVLRTGLDVVRVLDADDLPADRRARDLQTDAVGGVLVDVLDPAHVQRLRREQDVDAERTALAGNVIEQLGVLGMVGEHQGELVGDHQQRRDRRQVVPGSLRCLVLQHRVEGAALHAAAGLHQQLLTPRHLTAKRVREPVGQRALLGHVRDDGDHLWEAPEDVGAGLALEVGVDDDETLGRVSSQQRQQDRHQGLRLARARHTDHQTVRAHAAFGLVLQVEHQRLTGGGDADGHPELFGARARRPQAGDVERRRIRNPQQRAEGGQAGARAPGPVRVGVPAGEAAGQVRRGVRRKVIGDIEVRLPAGRGPPLDAAVGHAQHRAVGVRVLRLFRAALQHRDTGQAGPRQQLTEVGVGIVDDDQQVPLRRGVDGTERLPIAELTGQQTRELGDACGQVAGRADTVDLSGNVTVRQPLQPRP
ncbi:Uncharacterised protein [Mycobacteroides abscessus subsp. abscessus]|nr:Uncharacterised protein [Mycobacteroides abscessus subsp. abscessus]